LLRQNELTFVQDKTFTYLTRLHVAMRADNNYAPMMLDLEKGHEITFGQRRKRAGQERPRLVSS
jgi:hypothetical protein